MAGGKNRWVEWIRQEPAMLSIVAIGCVLRIVYVMNTPYFVRGNDVEGHLDYLRIIMSEWSAPALNTIWEAHQPTLYYILAGAWTAILQWMGAPNDAWQATQGFSLILSILTLLIGVRTAFLLFPGEKHMMHRLLFSGLLATYPSAVFMSARISNDALTEMLFAAFLFTLLRWWQSPTKRHWIYLCIATAFTCAVKVNAALALPIALLSLFCHQHTPLRRKLLLSGTLVACVLIVSTPFIIQKSQEGFLKNLLLRNEQNDILGITYGFDSRLMAPATTAGYLTFRPGFSMILPFVNPWSEESGRQNFWEYLYKSSLFGEWSYMRLIFVARVLLLLGMGIWLLAIAGGTGRQAPIGPFRVPLWITIGVSIAALAAHRALNGCACNQDFRLVAWLLIPIAAFAVGAIATLRPSIAKICIGWLLLFYTVSELFLLLLSFLGSAAY